MSQVEKSFNDWWKDNKDNLDLLRRLEKSNEQQIMEDEKLLNLLESFINKDENIALVMQKIIREYKKDKENVIKYKAQLADDLTYKKFKDLLNSKLRTL